LKTKSIEPLGYRVSWLASLFASRSDYKSLSLANDGMVLTGGKSAHNRISYLAITPDITVKQGFFWDVLLIPLVNGDILHFRGVAKKESESFQKALNHHCHIYIKRFYQRIVPDLQQAYQQACVSGQRCQ
jgi:hypothetical protein